MSLEIPQAEGRGYILKNALSIGHLSHKRTGLSRGRLVRISERKEFPGRLARPTSQEYDQKMVPLADLVHRICFWILVLIRPNPASEILRPQIPRLDFNAKTAKPIVAIIAKWSSASLVGVSPAR